jgi:hypothetical protein
MSTGSSGFFHSFFNTPQKFKKKFPRNKYKIHENENEKNHYQKNFEKNSNSNFGKKNKKNENKIFDDESESSRPVSYESRSSTNNHNEHNRQPVYEEYRAPCIPRLCLRVNVKSSSRYRYVFMNIYIIF